MFTAPIDRPLVNLRYYTIVPRKMGEFLAVFDQLAMPVLIRTLGAPIGFYTSTVGPLNQVVHLWAYRDMADMEARGQARDTDPDFVEYLRASAHLVTAQEDRLIKAAPLPSLGSGV
ncbi:MAG TPA: NIPSNAP family protein [Paenirhodobacter sp.]